VQAINEEPIAQDLNQALASLRECATKQDGDDRRFNAITFIRRLFENVLITVSRAGSESVNRRFIYERMSSDHNPIFVQENVEEYERNQEHWLYEAARIFRLRYGEAEQQSLWVIKCVPHIHFVFVQNRSCFLRGTQKQSEIIGFLLCSWRRNDSTDVWLGSCGERTCEIPCVCLFVCSVVEIEHRNDAQARNCVLQSGY